MFRTLGFTAIAVTLTAASALADEPDGLILPPGFHASIVADGTGLTGARHLAFGPNGDLYVSTGGGTGKAGTDTIALHLDAKHKADKIEHFGTVCCATGIRVYKGALYVASPTTIYRYKLSSALVPTGAPDVIVSGMDSTGDVTHAIAFDPKGNLYVAVNGTPGPCVNAAKVGIRPCPTLATRAGIWKFDGTKTDQKFPDDGEQYATGIRSMEAMDWSVQTGALYGVTQGRDGTHRAYPELVSADDDDNIGDEMHRITKGTNMGWPYTYYDGARHMRLTGPEYGGDNKTPADASVYDTPTMVFFSKRISPMDLTFYNGTKFPAKYRGGAFIPARGSNGPQPPSGPGYNVLFVPIDRNGDVKPVEIFADGFAGPKPEDRSLARAVYRPVGTAVGPDGALYVVDSLKARIWRISYGN